MKIVQQIIAGSAGALSLIYLLNPTAGWDFIPDFIPIVGNLDEAAAAAILIAALAYFGIDVTRLFGKASVDAAKTYGKGDVIEAETVKERVRSNAKTETTTEAAGTCLASLTGRSLTLTPTLLAPRT